MKRSEQQFPDIDLRSIPVIRDETVLYGLEDLRLKFYPCDQG